MRTELNAVSLSHDERVELFLALVEGNRGNIGLTCAQMGMSRNTYYKWMTAEGEAYDILRERIRQARRGWVDDLLDLAEERLEENVEKGFGQDVRFVLTKLGRDRGYGDKVDVTVHPGVPGLSYPEEPDSVEAFELLTAPASSKT